MASVSYLQRIEIENRLRAAIPGARFDGWTRSRGTWSLTGTTREGWRVVVNCYSRDEITECCREWFVAPPEWGLLTEQGGQLYGRGWVRELIDAVVSATNRIGTREVCPECRGNGMEASAPDWACRLCRGACVITLPVEVARREPHS